MHPSSRVHARTAAAFVAAVVAILLPSAAIAADAPIAGGQSSGDSLFAGIGNTGYDAQHYDVSLAYQPDGSIVASSVMDAVASQPLSSFSLDFEGLTVDSVMVDGQPAAFTRTSDPSIESYKLLVTPSAPVSGAFTVQVDYEGTPVTHEDLDGSTEGWYPTADGGATAVGQPVGTMTWIPVNNTPADKATYDFAYDIPDTLGGRTASVAGNGELVSKTPSGNGRTVWRWSQTHPMAAELAVAAIGVFDVTETPVVLARSGRTIPAWIFVHPDLSQSTRDDAAAIASRLEEMLNTLEAYYGPYPGDSTGFILGTTQFGYALETQDRPYFELGIDPATVVHELAHQWFGDSVTPADWNSIWLNEGPATYSELRYAHQQDPTTPTAEEAYFDKWSSVAADDALWSVAPAAMTEPAQLFGWQSYERGAMTLAALHDLVGAATFDRILQTWTARYGATSVTAADFAALVNEITGRDFTAFFREWTLVGEKPAWPAVWQYGLAAADAQQDPTTGDTRVVFTLTAHNSGQTTLTGGTVTVDASAVLDGATIADLPAELSRQGSLLTWSVPTTPPGDDATATFVADRAASPAGATLTAAVAVDPAALGASCGEQCSASASVAAFPPVGSPSTPPTTTPTSGSATGASPVVAGALATTGADTTGTGALAVTGAVTIGAGLAALVLALARRARRH